MKPKLTVVHGQAPELSTSFQTAQLCKHLEPWFEIQTRSLTTASSAAYQPIRFWRNHLAPLITRPHSDYILYGNDGLVDLRHWRGRRILYWYDASADWSVAPPIGFKDQLRCQNVRSADVVFAVSAAQVLLAKKLRPGRENSVHYLPVGVDCEFFDPSNVDRPAVRQRLGFGPQEVVVGYLGYLGRWKNRFAGEALLESAALLTDLKLKFLVIGTGPALSDWQRVVSNLNLAGRFQFAGFIPLAGLPATLAATDICVDTLEPGFHSEARSETKLKQYMAMGRACVATAIGENCVDLDHGRAGALAEPHPQALADAISSLAQQPDRRETLGKRARERAQTVYDWRLLAGHMATVVGVTKK